MCARLTFISCKRLCVFYFITNSICCLVSVYLFQVMSSLRLSATWAHPRCLDIMFVTLKKKEGKLRTLLLLYIHKVHCGTTEHIVNHYN